MKNHIVSMKHILLLAVIMMIPSCAVNPVTGKKQFMLMSESQEAQMGAEYHPQVMAAFGEYKNDNLLNYIQQKTNEMGKISHRPKVQWHVNIVDSPVVNAFAVPGGYLYLTRGILAHFNNEAELFGVIGHEMGHVTARHTASQQSRQQLGQVLLIGGMIASPKLAEYAQTAMQGMQLLFLKFSRDNEEESDRLGVEYSSKIGYDAHKMADFFQVLNKMSLAESQGGIPTFMSTHPDPGDRYTSVNKKANEWQAKLKSSDWKVNRESYLQMIDGIVYGEDPRQGYVEGTTFYHPELRFNFTYPAGWKYENQPTRVNMAPEDGKALLVFTLSGEKSLQAAADSSISQLGLTAQDAKKTTVDGMPAITVASQQVSQDQQTGQQSSILVLSYFIEYGKNFYVFHGVSSEADFKTYASSLESVMQSFSRLTDASKINVQPKKLHIQKVTSSGTLADAFKQYNVPQDQMSKIALLNNMELTDKVEAGRLIKVIGE